VSRPRYVRPSVPVGNALPAALRRLRDVLSTPAAADLIAGVQSIPSHDLERIADAIMAAHHEAHELVEVATGERRILPGHEAPGTVRHCFDVMDRGEVVKCILVTALERDVEGARMVALAMIADVPGYYLSRESRTLPTATE
jgi:hypothetical protein